MAKWLKRGACLVLCAAALVLCVSAASGSGLYFMAVNDTPLELSASTMPVRVGGVLYVPYHMFSTTATGVNLGVYASYNSARGQVLVYSSQKQLIFDLTENTVYDMDGNSYASRGMLRGSTAYLPIAQVCAVFSDTIWYSVSATPYGQLVRLKSMSAVLDDPSFIAAADSRLRGMYNSYLADNPTVTAVSPPTPTPTPGLSGRGAEVYLAFTLEDSGEETSLDQVLDALEELDARGIFFLSPVELSEQDDLVRRLIGQGHLVGARIEAGDAGEALEQMEEARDALRAVAKCRLCAVLCEGLEEDGSEEIRQEGVACWTTSVDGRDLEGTAGERAETLLPRLAAGESAKNHLLLDAAAGSTLRALLEAVTGADFQLKAPVPTALG